MKDVYIDMERFKLGLYSLEDTTKSPFGSARIMQNSVITDRGGIGPRPGTELLGTNNTSSSGIKGFYNFRKSYDENELLIKAYDDELEVYSKNHSSADWFRLKSGFTANKEFGFLTSLVNTDNEDYLVFCNRYENYQRWIGAVTQLNGALSGGETAVTVDSVLTNEIFESQTATGSSATTLTVSSATWADDMWINLYVYITSGAESGKIRKITDNSGTQITFDTLGGDPGNCTFEIRKLAFPASGTLIYGGTTIAYTAVPTATTFTVSSAHAASDNVAVTVVPTEYNDAPRGNRMTNYLGRVIVGRVRSALARDSGGALQGFTSGGSYFTSKINNPFDFDYSATRSAGEGDINATPYGGGEIEDIAHFEEAAYAFKRRYIESVSYSQDSNDLAVRTPLKAEVGSKGRVIVGSNDIYFFTDDNRFTSLGRVGGKDLKPQTENIGNKIKRLLDVYEPGTGFGIEDKNRIYVPLKSSSSETNNDIVLVYNIDSDSFEGIWDLSLFGLQRFNGGLYGAESNGANVYKLLTGKSDVVGTDRFPIVAKYATHFMNLTSSKANLQALNSMYYEGYIKGNTEITFKAWKDFSSDPFLEFTFGGDETSLLDGEELLASLGGGPLGLAPMGSVSEADEDGRRHFQFRVYFPFQYGNYFSVGHESSNEDDDYEITRYGLGLKEDVSMSALKVKSI